MSAALAASEQGAHVVLVDDQPSLGGSLRYDRRQYSGITGFEDGTGIEIGQRLTDRVSEAANIDVLSGANVFGCTRTGSSQFFRETGSSNSGHLRLSLPPGPTKYRLSSSRTTFRE